MSDSKKVIKGEEILLEIKPGTSILETNKKLAKKNKVILEKHNVRAIDIMGSIGAGKTSLIEKIVQKLKTQYKIAVIKGDLTTTIDADRIGRHGVQVITINTGRECHLDANLIAKAIEKINLRKIDLLIIENVGNLICPAEFPLGTDKRIVVVSVTEGPYMIIKHPFTFMNADIMVINKKDLAMTMKIDLKQLERQVKDINPDIKVSITNALAGEGIEDLIETMKIKWVDLVHELSMTAQIVESVIKTAKKQGAKKVTMVQLIIGKMTFLGIDQIRFAYNILIENTIMKDSKLKIIEKDGAIECTNCKYKGPIQVKDDPEYHVPLPSIACPKCGKASKIVEGKECIIMSIKMIKDD